MFCENFYAYLSIIKQVGYTYFSLKNRVIIHVEPYKIRVVQLWCQSCQNISTLIGCTFQKIYLQCMEFLNNMRSKSCRAIEL